VDLPVVEVAGRFPSPEAALAAAEALNRWFQWIVRGSRAPIPAAFEPLGVSTEDWAWSREEDTDWEIGPFARAAGGEARIALETRVTHLGLSRLLRALGARAVRIVHEEE
jgi:hypothetical protein